MKFDATQPAARITMDALLTIDLLRTTTEPFTWQEYAARILVINGHHYLMKVASVAMAIAGETRDPLPAAEFMRLGLGKIIPFVIPEND